MSPTVDRSDLYDVESQGDAPMGKLPPLPWLTAPETIELFESLQVDGATVRFVGGCVRDALANRPVNDLDVATSSPPDVTMELLERAGIRAIPTGIEHGTITAVINGQTYQITTLREDVATDGRRATVTFTNDWFADARRRDFTFNAMTATLQGDVYDPYGGIADLAYGRVRFIGKAVDRITEDYLRILRFFRFQATHGRPPANKDALSACRQLAGNLNTLSGERVRDEMMRIFATVGIADTLLLMRGEGVLEQVLPEAGDVGRLRALVWLTTRAIKLDSVALDPLRNLAASLSVDQGTNGADAIATRWKMSGKNRSRLIQMAITLDLEADAPRASINKYLYAHGPDLLRDRALLQWATEVGMEARLPAERTAAWIALLEVIEEWDPSTFPPFPLNGEDVLALGIAPGPRVGEALNQVKDWWCEGGFKADSDACLEKLEEVADRLD